MKKHVHIIYFLLLPLFSLGQKECAEMLEYQRARDFDSTSSYKRINNWQFASKLEQSKNALCVSYAYHIRAHVQLENNQFEEAQKSLDKERKLLDSIRAKKAYYIENQLLSGDLEVKLGNYEHAIEYYTIAIKRIIRGTNTAQLSKAFLGLALCYNKTNKLDKSIYFANLAHGRIIQLADNTQKVDFLLQLGNRYLKIYQRQKQVAYLDSTSHLASYANTLIQKMAYSDAKLNLYNLTGDHAYLSGNYRLSLRYLDSALNQTSPTYRWAERGSIYADMADVYLDIKSYEKAYVVADSNLYYVQKSGNPFEIANALELLYSCAKLSGEYERALSLYQDLSVLRDSIEKIEKANDLSRLEEKYYRVRREKSEAEYNQDQKLLKQQVEIGILKKRLILVGSIVLALLLAYVYMVFRQKNLKTKQKELEAQNRVNRSKFNADLIYQALNKIQEGDQVDSASYKKKVNSFSKLLKRALDSNFNDFMTIEKEIEFLSLYLNFLKENTKTDFTYLFEVDSNLDVRNCCVPALLLQPFIESIVRKGFKDLGKTGTITIYFQIRNLTELRIVIEDNGRGLKSIDSIRATEIINDRLFLLNKLNKTNASFFIRERVSGGVSVEVYLPIITKAFAEGLTLED